MSEFNGISRRGFLGASLAAAGAVHAAAQDAADADPPLEDDSMPCGMLGTAKLSRVFLGGNLIGGYMHARDLSYVNQLFRAYATEEKIIETLKIAADNGINTVFETGAAAVDAYNKKYNGSMRFIPHIRPDATEHQLEEDIKLKVDLGAVALYCWGAQSDDLVRTGQVGKIARAVEIAKRYGVPVGVGGHSLQVPVQCEREKVPCDFYVKTLHTDNYPSATPKELRKDFMWSTGGEGFYDNMWCIDCEETVEFFKAVEKPWVAFKVLAAGALRPRQAFAHAFSNGADFIAVGMFDFQVKQNCDMIKRVVAREQNRQRPWRA
ncbi:MAG: hypothetical protein RBS80_00235 [Thermoguttaceae bacterium]|jgi:hypothetical protein|nr:hypothetical protein [Thermoguttaceae bacterium]